jgi:hypothetical protein
MVLNELLVNYQILFYQNLQLYGYEIPLSTIMYSDVARHNI